MNVTYSIASLTHSILRPTNSPDHHITILLRFYVSSGTTVTAVQNIVGVTLAQATGSTFINAFTSATATSAGVPTSSVSLGTPVLGRRLLAGINQPYTISSLVAPVSLGGNNNLGTNAASNACFAGSEQVTMENGESKAMEKVQIGDRILTVNANGEQVFSDVAYLPHGKNQQRATFAQVSTATGRDLKMTLNHMLPAGACALSTLPFVAASAVMVGDCVQTVSGREQVVSINQVEGKGIYTIIAMEELIVVNGIVVTPFGGVNPTVANIFYNLYRVMYSATPAWIKAGRLMQGAAEGLWSVLSM